MAHTITEAPPPRATKQIPRWVPKVRRALEIYTTGGAVLLFDPLPEKKAKPPKKPKRTR